MIEWKLGGQGLHSRAEPHRPFLYLPMFQLENALHVVLVEAQQVLPRSDIQRMDSPRSTA